MAHDFELRRLTDKLKKLTEEQTRVNHQILKSRRDEQYELDHIRRRFNSQIQSLEEKQHRIAKEMNTHERQLHNLEDNIQNEKDEADRKMKEQLQGQDFSYRRPR